jgi:lysozyme family protein
MINGVRLLPFPTIEFQRTETTPVMSPGQGEAFLNLFVRSLAETKGKYSSAPSVLPLGDHLETPRAGDAGVDSVLRFVLKQEGSAYVHRDGKESSKYGVLQGTAARYGYGGDVRSMTQADAEAVYRKMWEESGAASLPPDLALVHFDTFVNSPSAARKILKTSAGNVDTYLNLRSRRYLRLSQLKPERYARYVKGWMNRIENLRHVVAENRKNTSTPAFG